MCCSSVSMECTRSITKTAWLPTHAQLSPRLGKTGVNYTRTTTSRPSDSFPGLMALVTGGSPRTVGAFYDVAYDRVLAPPKIDHRQRTAGRGSCRRSSASKLRRINGTQTEYEEGDEFDQTQLNGGGSPQSEVA